MNKFYYIIIVITSLSISCERDEVVDSNLEVANLKSQIYNSIDFNQSCNEAQISNQNPFNQELRVSGGYSFGSSFCLGTNRKADCFAIQLRQKLVTEFGKYSNNIKCGLKLNTCPENYSFVGGVSQDFVSLNTLLGVDTDGQMEFSISDENLIYRAFVCRLLENYDTSASEYLVINELETAYFLCTGCEGEAFITYNISVYREI